MKWTILDEIFYSPVFIYRHWRQPIRVMNPQKLNRTCFYLPCLHCWCRTRRRNVIVPNICSPTLICKSVFWFRRTIAMMGWCVLWQMRFCLMGKKMKTILGSWMVMLQWQIDQLSLCIFAACAGVLKAMKLLEAGEGYRLINLECLLNRRRYFEKKGSGLRRGFFQVCAK